MIHLKCTVVHYANLNSSSKNKPFLNYGPLNILFCFFLFLIYVYFNKDFVKKFMKELSLLNSNFENSFQDLVYYRILGCQTLWYKNVILKQNLKKWPLFFWSKIGIFNIFKKTIEGSFEDLEFNSKWKSVPLCPIKWWPLKFFATIRKSSLLISNVVKSAVSGLRQFLATYSP